MIYQGFMRKCRNWQTSKTKDLVVVTPCGFKTHLPHKNSAEQDIIIPVPRCFYAPQIWFLVISRTVSVGVPAISSPKISLSLPPCIISASLDLADA